MKLSEEEVKAIKEDLKWINLKEYPVERDKTRGIIDYLAPLGCLVTAGILGTGLYYLMKRDSKKQQTLMRLRVISQGVTAALAAVGIFTMSSSKSPR